jgi:hypothetical protein
MAVQNSDISDGADSSPDMGVQEWSAGLIYDQRCRIGKFAQTVKLMPAEPDIHTRWLVIENIRARSDEFIE